MAVAENTADELARSDGREVQLEEDPDLQLPFLLPEDGYSCDVVRNLPSGLQEFLEPLCQRGEWGQGQGIFESQHSPRTGKEVVLGQTVTWVSLCLLAPVMKATSLLARAAPTLRDTLPEH